MPPLRILILLLGDIFVLLSTYLITAYVLLLTQWIDFVSFGDYLWTEDGAQQIGFLTFTLVAGLYWFGFYSNIQVRSRRRMTEDLLLVLGMSFLIQALLSYAKVALTLSRWVMVYGSSALIFVLIGWRLIYSIILLRIVGRQRVLLWGDSGLTRELGQHIVDNPEKGYEIVGCVKESGSGTGFTWGEEICEKDNLKNKLLGMRLDRICVASRLSSNNALHRTLLECSMSGLRVENAGTLYEQVLQQVSLESLTFHNLIFDHELRPRIWVVALQNIYARLIALVGILLTWPIMLLTALAVKLDSEGPAILRQLRVGQNGEIFEILKFRSMYVDADKRFGRQRASSQDPRITRVGRFIRVTRLDELPQFINVLRGDMTIVGPRPEMPEYVVELTEKIEFYPQRLRVKPGITGWAQLHHKPEVGTEETKIKVQYDLYYIKNMSPALDFLIMFHTLRAILLRVGAN